MHRQIGVCSCSIERGEEMIYAIYSIYKKIYKLIKLKVLHSHHYRPMIQYVAENNNGKELVGCEIGVLDGFNAYNILYRLPMKKLYLVDPYIQYGIYPIPEKHLENAHKMVKQFKNRYQFIRKKSEDAVDDIPDNLDFVYVDGNHDYEFIKRDIELYYPKVKPSGIFGGHDFSIKTPDVIRAVLEFVDENGLELKYGKMGSTDWWVIKGEIL